MQYYCGGCGNEYSAVPARGCDSCGCFDFVDIPAYAGIAEAKPNPTQVARNQAGSLGRARVVKESEISPALRRKAGRGD